MNSESNYRREETAAPAPATSHYHVLARAVDLIVDGGSLATDAERREGRLIRPSTTIASHATTGIEKSREPVLAI